MNVDFHLIMSSVGRAEELERFLLSLFRQEVTYRLTLVEQNSSRTLESTLRRLLQDGTATYVHEPVVRGLSRGRNRALSEGIRGEIVCFPDDDCVYPDGVLESVRDRMVALGRDGITTRQVTPDGGDSMIRWSTTPGHLHPRDVPRTVNSSTLFLHRTLITRVGAFDETLGVGSGTPFGAGEENDYVLRALELGAHIDYCPDLSVVQADWREHLPEEAMLRKVRAYNRGLGRVLRKHGRHAEAAYWIARSFAGTTVRAFADRSSYRVQKNQLFGRWEGWIAPIDR